MRKIFVRVAKDLLAQQNRLRDPAPEHGCCRQIRHAHHIFVQPLAVRLFGGDLVLQFRVIDDAAFARIDEEHLARLKTAFMNDVLRLEYRARRLRRP